MKVYLVKKETNEIITEFDNVLAWDSNAILYQAGKGKCKIYSSDDEYFTDTQPQTKEFIKEEKNGDSL